MAIQIIEFWPDTLEDAGVTWNVEFHMLVKQKSTGELEWQYYGTDPAVVPPTGINSGAPVVQYARVQFPSGFNDLPEEESTHYLFQLGRLAGTNREGQY